MRILIIGCPGAGKSVLTKRINEFLEYPVMHLDKVFHTGGKTHISREELVCKVTAFANSYDYWIIDGNYISTLDMRVKLADTIIVLNIPTEVCLANVFRRSEEAIKLGDNRQDMAQGFDYTITGDFVNFIKVFGKETMPRIEEILKSYCDKTVLYINSYEDMENLIISLEREVISK